MIRKVFINPRIIIPLIDTVLYDATIPINAAATMFATLLP